MMGPQTHFHFLTPPTFCTKKVKKRGGPCRESDPPQKGGGYPPPFGTRFGPILDPFWTHFGPILDPFLGPFLGPKMGSKMTHFGPIFGSLLGPKLGPQFSYFWGPFGTQTLSGFPLPSLVSLKAWDRSIAPGDR